MFDIDKEKVKQALIVDGVQIWQIDRLLEKYPKLHEQMMNALNVWLENRTVSDIQIEGLSISDVMNTRRCHFLVAIRDLDRFYDENLIGDERDQWVRILKSPVYYE